MVVFSLIHFTSSAPSSIPLSTPPDNSKSYIAVHLFCSLLSLYRIRLNTTHNDSHIPRHPSRRATRFLRPRLLLRHLPCISAWLWQVGWMVFPDCFHAPAYRWGNLRDSRCCHLFSRSLYCSSRLQLYWISTIDAFVSGPAFQSVSSLPNFNRSTGIILSPFGCLDN